MLITVLLNEKSVINVILTSSLTFTALVVLNVTVILTRDVKGLVVELELYTTLFNGFLIRKSRVCESGVRERREIGSYLIY